MATFRKKRTTKWLATTALGMSAVGAIQASAANLTAGDFDLTKQATSATFPVMFERPTGINAAAIAGALQQLGTSSELYKSALAAVPELSNASKVSTLLNDALSGDATAKATIVKLINWYNSQPGSVRLTTASGATYTVENLDQPVSTLVIAFGNNGQNATISNKVHSAFTNVRTVGDLMTKIDSYKAGLSNNYRSAFNNYATQVYAQGADIAALSSYNSVKPVLDAYEDMYNQAASTIRTQLLADNNATEAAIVFFESAVLTGGMNSGGGTEQNTPTQTYTTRYVDNKGNLLTPNETGDKFRDAKTFTGYTLTNTETSGNTRTYTYTPNEKTVTRWVDDKGNTLKPQSDGSHPDMEGDDIPGYVLIKRESTTENGTTVIINTYHKPVELTKWQDESGTPLKTDESGTKPDTEGDDIPGYTIVSSRTSTDENGDKTTVNVYKKNPETPEPTPTPEKKVHTHWFDEEGNSLKPRTEGSLPDKEGDDIPGYTHVRTVTITPEQADGAFKDTGILAGDVINIYKKTPEVKEVTTRWIDEQGKELKPSEKGAKPDAEGDDIPNYRLVRVTTDNEGNVTNVYKLVTTRYVDPNGKDLIPPKDGTHTKEEIPGYVHTETKVEGGNTIHVYNPLTTRYVDPNGKDLIPPKDGTHKQEVIPGYVHIETKVNGGNTVHVYRPNTTQWIDESGKPLKDPVNGVHPDKEGDDVPGYTLVETRTNEQGDVVNVYKLVQKKATHWVDTNGKTLKDSVEGTHPDEDGNDIAGYTLVEIRRTNEGDVVNVYKQIVKQTFWVDTEGKALQEPKEGTFPDNDGKSDIVGYVLKEIKTDKDGNVTNVYEQVKGDVITHFVDREGNRIADDIKGEKFADKKDIRGYKYVETLQSPDGKEIFHVYEKVGESNIVPSTPVTTITTAAPASLPKTGDAGSIMTIIGGVFASLGAMVGLKRRKKD